MLQPESSSKKADHKHVATKRSNSRIYYLTILFAASLFDVCLRGEEPITGFQLEGRPAYKTMRDMIEHPPNADVLLDEWQTYKIENGIASKNRHYFNRSGWGEGGFYLCEADTMAGLFSLIKGGRYLGRTKDVCWRIIPDPGIGETSLILKTNYIPSLFEYAGTRGKSEFIYWDKSEKEIIRPLFFCLPANDFSDIEFTSDSTFSIKASLTRGMSAEGYVAGGKAGQLGRMEGGYTVTTPKWTAAYVFKAESEEGNKTGIPDKIELFLKTGDNLVAMFKIKIIAARFSTESSPIERLKPSYLFSLPKTGSGLIVAMESSNIFTTFTKDGPLSSVDRGQISKIKTLPKMILASIGVLIALFVAKYFRKQRA